MKKIVAAFMQAAPDAATAEKLRAKGIAEEDITNKAALVMSLYDAAMSGNTKAFETLMKYSGDDPDEQRKESEQEMKRDMFLLELKQIRKKVFYNFDGEDDTIQEKFDRYSTVAIANKYPELAEAAEDAVSEYFGH